MTGSQREEVEASVRRAAEAGDLALAAEQGLRAYGREIFEFLVALHRDAGEASEVFSLFAEGLWRSLPAFAWHCTFRTWAYAIARRASLRHRRDERRRHARLAPLPDDSRLEALCAQIRTETAPWLRTEKQSRFAELRASLPKEDQALLMLRVDRQLSWNDLAQVLREEDEGPPLAGEALKREAARLRKRFQVVKERLYELGREAGLIGEG
jgi:RNA polymerase sigma-70 factor (ECF subfamily)